MSVGVLVIDLSPVDNPIVCDEIAILVLGFQSVISANVHTLGELVAVLFLRDGPVSVLQVFLIGFRFTRQTVATSRSKCIVRN